MRIAAPTSTLVPTSATTALPTMTSRVDPEGARRIMEMLVNLYSDQRLAIAREYLSNAVDATRVAGSSAPVEVTIPTVLDPNLIITDHGVGMSTAEVEAAFLAFAASTKRDTNELIGGLGVGAKSAWTLAESFLVDTVKDGKRTVVRAARNLSHQVVLAGVPSDAPSGTTITVPLEVSANDTEWRRVVNEVACAHPAGAVLVDGEPVPSFYGGPTWIGPVACQRVRRDDLVTIISGGTLFASVPKITNRVLTATELHTALIELPVGSFDHTPSRENVIATDRTIAAIDAALAAYKAAYTEIAARVEKLCETDVAAALELRADTLGGFGTPNHLPIPFKINVPRGIGIWTYETTRGGRSSWAKLDAAAAAQTFPAISGRSAMARTVVVSEVPAGRVLRGFAKFLEGEDSRLTQVIPIAQGQQHVELEVLDRGNRDTGQRWLIGPDTAKVTHYTFEQWTAALAAARVPRGTATSSYECALTAADGEQPEYTRLTAAEIAALDLPVWYTAGECPTYRRSSDPASVAVYLGRRKTGPLLAAVPAAMDHPTWIEHRYTSLTAGWSQLELLVAAYRNASYGDRCLSLFPIVAEAVKRLPAGSPSTPALERAAEVLAAAEALPEGRAEALIPVRACPAGREPAVAIANLCAEITRAYPLLEYVRGYRDEAKDNDFVEYMVHIPPVESDNNT